MSVKSNRAAACRHTCTMVRRCIVGSLVSFPSDDHQKLRPNAGKESKSPPAFGFPLTCGQSESCDIPLRALDESSSSGVFLGSNPHSCHSFLILVLTPAGDFSSTARREAPNPNGARDLGTAWRRRRRPPYGQGPRSRRCWRNRTSASWYV